MRQPPPHGDRRFDAANRLLRLRVQPDLETRESPKHDARRLKTYKALGFTRLQSQQTLTTLAA